MKLMRRDSKDFECALEALYRRPAFPAEVEKSVAEIVESVRKGGDNAIRGFIKKFDGADVPPSKFRVSEEEFKEASRSLSSASKRAIKESLRNVTAFARRGMPEDWSFSPRKGVVLGERFEPMERIGCYIPGGTAPLVSTVVHTVGLAKAAGVREIVAATPPGRGGRVNAATLCALELCGATEVYRMGGAYAIAAMAFGTKSVPKVEKIVGPGNAYVTAAKRLAYGHAAIDMVAGPSEIMIVADAKADPSFVAADMLSQAEHGSGLEQAVLLSPSRALLEKVRGELLRQSKTLSRGSAVEKVLKDGVFLIECHDFDEAAEIASRYAPEHLELHCANPERLASRIKAAGAIFMGPWTPEPVGDFTAGPSHVLPTAGSARFFHGLTAADFLRRSSLIKYDRAALMKELPSIEALASLEGLDAHGRSASIRKGARIK